MTPRETPPPKGKRHKAVTVRQTERYRLSELLLQHTSGNHSIILLHAQPGIRQQANTLMPVAVGTQLFRGLTTPY